MSEQQGNIIPGEAEVLARAQGWKPQEEWVGDPEKWMPADKFIEVGQRVHKVKVGRLERQIQEQQAVIAHMRQAAMQTEERAYKRAMADLEARQAKAVAEADSDEYQRINKEKERITRDAQEAIKSMEIPVDPSKDPIFVAWLEENDWYETDADMSSYADGLAPRVARETGLQGKALLDEVAKRTKKTFAAKIRNPRRDEASSVEGGKPSGGGKGGAKTFDDLPAEAKKAYDKFARQIPGFSKEEYLKNYVW